MQFMRRFSPLSIIFSCFIILFISPSVSASGLSPEFWAYWWAENQCHVDFSKYKNTDEGSSLNDLINRYGERSVEESEWSVYDFFERYFESTGEHLEEMVENQISYANNVFDNITTTNDKVNDYLREKASRTFIDGDKEYLNVSGSDYWDSIYNDLFNDGGYKQQYEENNNNDTYSGECCGHSITVSIKDAYYITVTGSECPVINGLYSELAEAYGYANSILTWNIDGNLWYSLAQYGGYAIKSMTTSGNEITLTIIVNDIWNNREYEETYKYYINGGTAGDNDSFEPEGGLTPKPPSCGVIHLNGEWVDVPTDPDNTPEGWVINPDGTVTIDGQDYPIYVETDSGDDDEGGDSGGNPGQLTEPGLFDIIKYIGRQPWGNNWNNPWNNYNQPDGNNSNNPFGLSLDGFFNNIGKAIGNVFDKLLGNIPKLLEKILDIIKSLFSLNFLSSMRLDLNLHFNFINGLFSSLLSLLGVS